MSKHYSNNRDVNDYISALVQAGWTFTKGNGGHGKITAPNGRHWGVPSTPGDWRALPNLRRDLKHLAALPAAKTRRVWSGAEPTAPAFRANLMRQRATIGRPIELL